MRLTSSVLLSLALSLALSPSSADAQAATASVSVANLTVDGDPPPGTYRDLLRTGLQPTLGPVLECYQTALRTTPSRQGTLRLRLWVSAREVIRATEEESTLGDDTLDECARARVRLFRLPDAAPTGGASVTFTLFFLRTGIAAGPTPGDVFARVEGPVPAAAPPAPPAPPPVVSVPIPPTTAPIAPRATIHVDTVTGSLDEAAILSSLPLTAFDACPAGTGDRVLTLSIARAGTVRVTAGRGTLRERTVFQCVMRTIRETVMPSARRSTRATITLRLTR